jgi:hypothetical protein
MTVVVGTRLTELLYKSSHNITGHAQAWMNSKLDAHYLLPSMISRRCEIRVGIGRKNLDLIRSCGYTAQYRACTSYRAQYGE